MFRAQDIRWPQADRGGREPWPAEPPSPSRLSSEPRRAASEIFGD